MDRRIDCGENLIVHSFLNWDVNEEYNLFLKICTKVGLSTDFIDRVAKRQIIYLRKDVALRKKLLNDCEISQIDIQIREVTKRWYDSLSIGNPDYSVYDNLSYLGELWACWIVYSRKYLLNVRSIKSLPESGGIIEDIGKVKCVVDLGCGLGFSTAALCEIYPNAEVFGIEIEGTKRYEITEVVGNLYGFKVYPDFEHLDSKMDLVFASEYFEHFRDPVEHLIKVINCLHPRALIVANSFGVVAIGHFDLYSIFGEIVSPKKASIRFNNTLRFLGYEKVKTKLWNSRPTYWKLKRSVYE